MQPQLLTVIKQEVLKRWTSDEWRRWWIEPKRDGYRLIYHKGQFLSRTGKPFHNLDHIAAELSQLPGWTFDGELYGKNWEEAANARRSKNGVNNELNYAVFDIMSDDDWCGQMCAEPLEQRRLRLLAMINGRLIPMKYVHVMSHFEATRYESFVIAHKSHLQYGCDGTVLKLRDSLYEFKRTKTWLKVKPVETFDCLVVGMKEGIGKYKGMLGALQLVDADAAELLEQSEWVTTWCSGMTDEQRRSWWGQDGKGIIGKIIEVSARGVHKSGRLIEPRFVRIREDK